MPLATIPRLPLVRRRTQTFSAMSFPCAVRRQASGCLAASPQSPEETRATVGKFLGVRAGKSLLVGLIADVSLRAEPLQRDHEHLAMAQLDLIGEIHNNETPSAYFQRGVSSYPAIGDPVSVVGSRRIAALFSQQSVRAMIEVGQLQQDSTIRRPRRSRRNAEQAFCGARHDRRRQIERRDASAASDPGGAPGSAGAAS